MFALAAALLFILAAFGVSWEAVNIVYFGACLAALHLFTMGSWPFGSFRLSRRE